MTRGKLQRLGVIEAERVPRACPLCRREVPSLMTRYVQRIPGTLKSFDEGCTYTPDPHDCPGAQESKR